MSVKRIGPGQPFEPSAAFHNATAAGIELAQMLYRGQRDAEGNASIQTGVCLVKNTSSETVPRFGVLGIDAPLLTPTENLTTFQSIPAFTGSTPTAPQHRGRFCVLLEPVKPGKIARAVFSGVTVAKLNIECDPTSSSSSMPEPGSGEYADIKDGTNTCLDSNADGSARVLWHEDAIGEVWALVNIGTYHRGQIVGVTLTEDLGATTAHEAACTVRATWDFDSESFTGNEVGVFVDPESVFEGAIQGATGYARKMQGNKRIVYLGENLTCGPTSSSSSSSSSSGT